MHSNHPLSSDQARRKFRRLNAAQSAAKLAGEAILSHRRHSIDHQSVPGVDGLRARPPVLKSVTGSCAPEESLAPSPLCRRRISCAIIQHCVSLSSRLRQPLQCRAGSPQHRGLTGRSSGPPPAWHLAREALWFIIRLTGQAPYRRRPLSSNVRCLRSLPREHSLLRIHCHQP